MNTDERLVKLEQQLVGVKEEVAEARTHGQELGILTAMVREIKNQLDRLASTGTTRCAERGEIIKQLQDRISRLEGGQSPTMSALSASQQAIQSELQDIRARLMPLEKKILMWIGAVGLLSFAAPFIFKIWMMG